MNFKKLLPEDFEYLIEDILKAKGFSIVSRPGRGPDQSRDMIAERLVTNDMRISTREVWLVQCKHLAASSKDKSVLETDIPNFFLKAKQHHANRYLIATTTVVSETVKDNFNSLNNDEQSGLKCAYFNKYDLTDYIRLYPELYEKYFNPDNQPLEEKGLNLIRFLRRHYFEVHRGAILYDANITAVFGNDGYTHATQQALKKLRTLLKAEGVHEINFIKPAEGSWCMFIQSNNAKYYHDKLWEFFPAAEDYKKGQDETNFARLWTHWDNSFIITEPGL